MFKYINNSMFYCRQLIGLEEFVSCLIQRKMSVMPDGALPVNLNNESPADDQIQVRHIAD